MHPEGAGEAECQEQKYVNPLELIHRFQSTVSAVREWIDSTLDENRSNAVSVSALNFHQLDKVLPAKLLNRAQVVIVTGKVPFPPLSRMGLPELAQMETMQMAGVTYKDTYFINQLQQTESLHFHELIHVIQWERLGADDFLLAYGAGLMQFGYRACPFEKMAYDLQSGFERGVLPENIMEPVQQKTDAIWAGVKAMLPIT